LNGYGGYVTRKIGILAFPRTARV